MLIWYDDVGKLKVKVESKCKSFRDLIVSLSALKVEKNGPSEQLETLQKLKKITLKTIQSKN